MEKQETELYQAASDVVKTIDGYLDGENSAADLAFYSNVLKQILEGVSDANSK